MNTCTISPCVHCPVLADTVFETCASEAIDPVCTPREFRSYAPGSIIFTEGHPVTGAFCVCSGSVILRKRDDLGIEHDVAHLGPGSLIGFRSPTEPGNYCVTASAHAEITAGFIPIDEMFALAQRHPSIVIRLLQSFCQRIGALREQYLRTGDDIHQASESGTPPLDTCCNRRPPRT